MSCWKVSQAPWQQHLVAVEVQLMPCFDLHWQAMCRNLNPQNKRRTGCDAVGPGMYEGVVC